MNRVNSSSTTKIREHQPVRCEQLSNGNRLYDFGRTRFGYLRARAKNQSLPEWKGTVFAGEFLDENRGLQRTPPGTLRIESWESPMRSHQAEWTFPVPVIPRHTRRPAVLPLDGTPPLMPIRYLEWESPPSKEILETIQWSLVEHYWPLNWDEGSLAVSDPQLQSILDVGKNSLESLTFTGLFIDGERERIPYEGDALLGMLIQFAHNGDPSLTLASLRHFQEWPTWPTEWTLQIPIVAELLLRYTGCEDAIRPLLPWLIQCTSALLWDPVKGLDTTCERPDLDWTEVGRRRPYRDIVDWPHKGHSGPDCPGETDDFEFTSHNTVVHCHLGAAFRAIGFLLQHLESPESAAPWFHRSRAVTKWVQKHCWDEKAQRFRDGPSSDHHSQHANVQPLAWGMASREQRIPAIDYILSKGWKCSPFGAYFLLEAAFRQGRGNAVLPWIHSDGNLGFGEMAEQGNGLAWEAWNFYHKPNQDWSHIWGAAPTAIVPRHVAGIRPRGPGFSSAVFRPQPSDLESAQIRIPTPLGPLSWEWEQSKTSGKTRMKLECPSPIDWQVDFRFLPGVLTRSKVKSEDGRKTFDWEGTLNPS